MNTNINTNTTNSNKVIPGINDVATKCPQVAAMWSDKNAFFPSKVAAGSRRKFTFVCPDCGQEFESKIFSVVRSVMNGNTGCPVCAGKKIVSGINDLATKCPMAATMWSNKNAFTPSEAPAGSHKKAVFVCPDCGQEFESSICNVVNSLMRYRTGCPVCRGLKVVSGINDLATKCPAAANMWSDKNACSPSKISAGNNKMAWFVCPDCRSLRLPFATSSILCCMTIPVALFVQVARLFPASTIWRPCIQKLLLCGAARTITPPAKFLLVRPDAPFLCAPIANKSL